MKKIVYCILVNIIVSFANAGDVESKIVRAGVATDQYYMIQIATPAESKPSCATSLDVFSIDRLSDSGEKINEDKFSLILAALMADKRVFIAYSDECGLWGTRPKVTRVDVYK